VHLYNPPSEKGVFLIYRTRRPAAFALAVYLCLSPIACAFAEVLGPASSYEELLNLLASARDGDTVLVSGEIYAQNQPALSTDSSVHIKSEDNAIIHGLHLNDASVSLTGIQLDHSLSISGTSHVQLGKNVSITGASGSSGISFSGNGTLIIEPGCRIEGGQGSSGVSISHSGGEFYGSIEGSVRGGDGISGGTGVIISPLRSDGAVMITGSIIGGSGDGLGGHALNLYDLSGNAYVTVAGKLQGGNGSIGGDGIQLVSASDSVNVGVNGQVKGGAGENHGGNALILMDVEDSSSFHFSGTFSGGDAMSENAQPGTSLHLVGDSASLRARIGDCILEDGRLLQLAATPAPESMPSSEIAAAAEDSTANTASEEASTTTPEPIIEPAAPPVSEAPVQALPESVSEPESESASELTTEQNPEAWPESSTDPNRDPDSDSMPEPADESERKEQAPIASASSGSDQEINPTSGSADEADISR